MHTNKRLLILGAGPDLRPAILRAVERGVFAITTGYVPESTGYRSSDQSINCSTVDKGGILTTAKEHASGRI